MNMVTVGKYTCSPYQPSLPELRACSDSTTTRCIVVWKVVIVATAVLSIKTYPQLVNEACRTSRILLTASKSKPAIRTLYESVSSDSCATNAFALLAHSSSYNTIISMRY